MSWSHENRRVYRQHLKSPRYAHGLNLGERSWAHLVLRSQTNPTIDHRSRPLPWSLYV
nr:MAG TPA: hypothetical protein [Caudoviricetes sp.]